MKSVKICFPLSKLTCDSRLVRLKGRLWTLTGKPHCTAVTPLINAINTINTINDYSSPTLSFSLSRGSAFLAYLFISSDKNNHNLYSWWNHSVHVCSSCSFMPMDCSRNDFVSVPLLKLSPHAVSLSLCVSHCLNESSIKMWSELCMLFITSIPTTREMS